MTFSEEIVTSYELLLSSIVYGRKSCPRVFLTASLCILPGHGFIKNLEAHIAWRKVVSETIRAYYYKRRTDINCCRLRNKKGKYKIGLTFVFC